METIAAQLALLEPDVYDFDLEQNKAERDDMYSALSSEDKAALNFVFANAILAGCSKEGIARHTGKPARHFMATSEEIDDEEVSGVDYYIRKICLMWQLRTFRGKRGVLYDFCGWVDDGGVGGVEVGAGVLGAPDEEGKLEYVLAFVNKDGALTPASPPHTEWVENYQKVRI
jgi:hypothetical protein